MVDLNNMRAYGEFPITEKHPKSLHGLAKMMIAFVYLLACVALWIVTYRVDSTATVNLFLKIASSGLTVLSFTIMIAICYLKTSKRLQVRIKPCVWASVGCLLFVAASVGLLILPTLSFASNFPIGASIASFVLSGVLGMGALIAGALAFSYAHLPAREGRKTATEQKLRIITCVIAIIGVAVTVGLGITLLHFKVPSGWFPPVTIVTGLLTVRVCVYFVEKRIKKLAAKKHPPQMEMPKKRNIYQLLDCSGNTPTPNTIQNKIKNFEKSLFQLLDVDSIEKFIPNVAFKLTNVRNLKDATELLRTLREKLQDSKKSIPEEHLDTLNEMYNAIFKLLERNTSLIKKETNMKSFTEELDSLKKEVLLRGLCNIFEEKKLEKPKDFTDTAKKLQDLIEKLEKKDSSSKNIADDIHDSICALLRKNGDFILATRKNNKEFDSIIKEIGEKLDLLAKKLLDETDENNTESVQNTTYIN